LGGLPSSRSPHLSRSQLLGLQHLLRCHGNEILKIDCYKKFLVV
jgi:hypothetical protein